MKKENTNQETIKVERPLTNGRYGRLYWQGPDADPLLFTNRNPKTGELWTDDFGKDGMWVSSERVIFVD